MSRVQVLLFVFAIAVCSHAKELCHHTDTACTTALARDVFKVVVSGIEGFFKSSDPLFLSEVEFDVSSVHYQLSNVTLTGMKQCQVSLLRLDDDRITYQYNLRCPQLVLKFHHECKGSASSIEIDTNGFATITLDDYMLKINGKFNVFTKENDLKRYFSLNGFTLETEPKRKMTFVADSGKFHNDETKSSLALTYITEHMRDIERTLKSSAMEKFVAMYLNNLDAYLRKYSFDVDLQQNATV